MAAVAVGLGGLVAALVLLSGVLCGVQRQGRALEQQAAAMQHQAHVLERLVEVLRKGAASRAPRQRVGFIYEPAEPATVREAVLPAGGDLRPRT